MNRGYRWVDTDSFFHLFLLIFLTKKGEPPRAILLFLTN